jgi:hypothetical protein
MMTVKAPKPWIEGEQRDHPFVAGHASQRRRSRLGGAAEISGHLSGSDGGVHLSDDTAKQFYRDIILEALGLPT